MDEAYRDHIIGMIVENKPGVLFRVTNLIRRRGFNIQSITVGLMDGGKLSRMTIVVKGDDKTVELIARNLHKLIETVKINRMRFEDSVQRELALIRVNVNDSKTRSDLIHFLEIFRGRVVDVSTETMIVEVTGSPDKIDAFLNLVKDFGVTEVARTGMAALWRGNRAI